MALTDIYIFFKKKGNLKRGEKVKSYELRQKLQYNLSANGECSKHACIF